MSEPIPSRTLGRPRWPMTGEARSRLVDEIALLRAALRLPPSGEPDDGGLVRLPVHQAARRLETLTAVLDGAEAVADDRCVIGRRATIREEDGTEATYWLVFPGDGDPGQGWVSPESPLGAAILGTRPGETVEVVAPAGRRTISVIAVG